MATKKAVKSSFSKSAFIRSQPSTLSGAQVVENARKAGLKLTKEYVYKVRAESHAKRQAGAGQGKVGDGAGAMSSVSAPGANKARAVSKADFVRAHASLSPREIVAKARTEGIKLAESYVYNVRTYDRAKSKRATGHAARLPSGRIGPSVPRPITTMTSAEELLKAVGAELGLARAIEILQAERARVHAVFRR